MKNKFISLLFSSFFLLLGCSIQSYTNTRDLEKQFATAFPIADMNKSLHMTVYEPNGNYS